MKKNIRNTYEDCAILVLSCDKYSDLWKPFFSQFHKFWPHHPLKTYLGSNTKKYHDHLISTIFSGVGIDWSTDLRAILEQMKEEYIFIWLEDILPTSSIDTKNFLRCFQFLKTTHANHIHFNPAIQPDGICRDSLFGYYEKTAPYRVIAAGFWKKEHLQQLLLPGEDPWKFEIMGSYRSSYYDGYYTINKPLFQFIRVVNKGKIIREAYEYCIKNGIELDITKRQVDTRFDQIKSDITNQLFQVILKVPWRIRLHLMELLRRILISY